MTPAHRHPSETPIGWLQHRQTRDGRRLLLAVRRTYTLPEPWYYGWRDHLRDIGTILAPYAVVAIFVVGFWLWFALAAAAQVPA